MHVGVYACCCVCMFLRMHVSAYACWCVCMLVCMHVGVYACCEEADYSLEVFIMFTSTLKIRTQLKDT